MFRPSREEKMRQWRVWWLCSEAVQDPDRIRKKKRKKEPCVSKQMVLHIINIVVQIMTQGVLGQSDDTLVGISTIQMMGIIEWLVMITKNSMLWWT